MIEVDKLSFSYPQSDSPAVRSISFKVADGEIFGFLGPSGAGKSTTQKILIGLLRDYKGTVQLCGRDLSTWDNSLYERIGVSFEFPNHYLKLTALENLQYFAGLYSGETEDPLFLLQQVGLGEDGDKRVGQFSKGMRGRLNIARALVNRPDLLFLDEPTAGLDPVTSRIIRELIRRHQEAGTTVFLTTHDMAVADELCDRVGFIVDGGLELIDAPRKLKLVHGKRSVRVELVEDGKLTSLEFPLGALADNADFLGAIRSDAIQTIHTQETTLEDIFIQVTGRSLS
jgi:fluoroquinolone transport system ATP-binding protein